MKNVFTVNTLTLLLLTVTAQISCSSLPNNPPSYYQVIIELIFGKPEQQQDNPNQAPAGITAQDYIAQFRADLNGATQYNQTPVIPWNEVDEMSHAIGLELYYSNVNDKDKTNQIIRSVVLNHVKTKTALYLKQLEQEGFYITSEEHYTIPKSQENNIRVRLENIPHLNGESIAQYFGETHKNKIKENLRNRNNYYNPFDPSRGAHQ